MVFGVVLYRLVQSDTGWCSLVQPGAVYCSVVHILAGCSAV